jgi:hypothetical protein
MTQVTFGPLHMGGSALAGKIKQRHDPQLLSNILQSPLALHDRSGAAGAVGMLGSDCLRSGVLGADASSSDDGACVPEDPEGIMRGAPTRVMGADSAGRSVSDAAVGVVDSDFSGFAAALPSRSGALAS